IVVDYALSGTNRMVTLPANSGKEVSGRCANDALRARSVSDGVTSCGQKVNVPVAPCGTLWHCPYGTDERPGRQPSRFDLDFFLRGEKLSVFHEGSQRVVVGRFVELESGIGMRG